MARKEAFLPVFFGDFLSSTIYWRGEEKALYLLLLGYQWSSGPLPSDPIQLAQVACYEAKQFIKLWEVVGKKFVETGSGLVNRRLEEHREKSHQVSSKRAAIGSKGGEASAAARAAKAAAKHPASTQANGQPIGSNLVNGISSKRRSKFQPSNPIHPTPNEEEESEACHGQERRVPS